jgi:hypothetical protein
MNKWKKMKMKNVNRFGLVSNVCPRFKSKIIIIIIIIKRGGLIKSL